MIQSGGVNPKYNDELTKTDKTEELISKETYMGFASVIVTGVLGVFGLVLMIMGCSFHY